MSIQSLSIVVPSKNCINNCKFCVSKMHGGILYEDRISQVSQFYKVGRLFGDNDFSSVKNFYVKALKYAKDLGCNTLMLTGECEPQQNLSFLECFFKNLLPEGLFNNIEIQTTGRGINRDVVNLLSNWGVNTFSLSLSSFDERENGEIIGIPSGQEVQLMSLCKDIKDSGCLLRLSLNLNKCFYGFSGKELFDVCSRVYEADQVTLRKLYTSPEGGPQSQWIEKNCDNEKDEEYFDYIRDNGSVLEVLPYGNVKYSVDGVGTVADGDCMSKNNPSDIRYLILRPNCHLYTRWDDPASIVF